VRVEAFYLPGPKLLDLFGILIRLRSKFHYFLRDNRRCGVMSMPCSGGRRKTPDNDIRLKLTQNSGRVRQDCIASPDGERLFRRFRKSEVYCPGEKLLTAINPSCGEQLLGSDKSETIANLGTNQILPSISPSQRQVRRGRQTFIRQVSNNVCILVIRMRSHIQD